MDLISSILLGLLQGITEFLPVSSSGHLVLARALLNQDLSPGITFEIVVHFGSFCSIALYYRQRLTEILSNLFRSLTPSGLSSGRWKNDPDTRLCWIILLSMIPAMAIGFTLKDVIEGLFMNPVFVSFMLLVTGTLLFSTRFIGQPTGEVTATRGLLMGIAQACAIIPGISRAGSTIVTGLYSGINRDSVANFSFIMVLPVLAGAMLLEIIDLQDAGLDAAAIGALTAGFLTSFLSGFLALSYLIRLLKREKFHLFSWYCWAVGIFGIVWFW
ncbi:MAG: undecaprenyl-diphosphate phosphatase [Balneolaceae bacterium]